jgi:small subunit ribosomal protein S19
MSQSDVAKILTSDVRRKINRGIKLDKKILAAIESNAKGEIQRKPVRTHCRDVLIMPNMVGLKFAVYNGKSFENIDIKPEMIGFYLGEFVVTRKRPVHSKAGIGATRSSKHTGKK